MQAFEDELRDEVSRRLGMAISVWQDTSKHSRRRKLAGRHSGGHRRRRRVRGDRQPALSELAMVRPRAQRIQEAASRRSSSTTSGRFFKAVKTPWPDNTHRLFLQEIQDVDFYKERRGRLRRVHARLARLQARRSQAGRRRRAAAAGACAAPTSACTWRGPSMNASPPGAAERRASQQGLRRAADGPARCLVRRQAADAGHGQRGAVRAPARLRRTTSSPSASRCSRPISSTR